VQALGFGLPNLVAPKQAKELNWESTVNADDTPVRFMGHGITTAGFSVATMNNLDGEDKKEALKGLSVLHASVAAMVGHATYNKELKQQVGIANVVVHSALAIALAARGFRKDKEE
jgi:hypothetical protein